MFVPFIVNFNVFSGIGCVESMLGTFMTEHIGATQNQVGLTFFLLGGVYMISSLFGGMVKQNSVVYFQK